MTINKSGLENETTGKMKEPRASFAVISARLLANTSEHVGQIERKV